MDRSRLVHLSGCLHASEFKPLCRTDRESLTKLGHHSGNAFPVQRAEPWLSLEFKHVVTREQDCASL